MIFTETENYTSFSTGASKVFVGLRFILNFQQIWRHKVSPKFIGFNPSGLVTFSPILSSKSEVSISFLNRNVIRAARITTCRMKV